MFDNFVITLRAESIIGSIVGIIVLLYGISLLIKHAYDRHKELHVPCKQCGYKKFTFTNFDVNMFDGMSLETADRTCNKCGHVDKKFTIDFKVNTRT